MTADGAFEALGSPTRRAVLDQLRSGERTVAQLTTALPVTQSAVSQHMRVLKEAGLVRMRTEGTRHLYSVDLGGLGELRAWVDRFWDDVLTAFTDYANQDAASIAEEDPT